MADDLAANEGPKPEDDVIKDQMEDLKDELNKRLETLEHLVNQPFLFISDYFSAIRNEIDLAAESLLAGKASEQDPLQINEMREMMLDELKFYEKTFLSSIGLITSSDASKISSYKREIRAEYVEALNTPTTHGLNELAGKYNQIEMRLVQEIGLLESRLFNHTTIFFKQGLWNPFGVLVIFNHVYLNQLEVKFIK